MPSKLHTSPTATPLAPNFWTNKIQNCLHVLKCNHKFHSLLSFWATTPLQSSLLSLLFVRHMHLKLQHFNCKTHGFLKLLQPQHLEWFSPRHQVLLYSLFLQRQTQDIPLLRIFQLSNIVLHPYQSVQCVCTCAHACVCWFVCTCTFCIVVLKPLSPFRVSFFFFFFFKYTNIFYYW